MTNTKLLETYFDRLWPICRSITGNGLRESLKILQELFPLSLFEIPSGTIVLDWEVPSEWNIEDAYIISPSGEKIADFKKNNLHVVNYSIPVDMECTYDELVAHLHTRKDLPEAIPYVTSYYRRDWGFCIDYNTFLKLPKKGKYRVIIKSELKHGSLTYGEAVLKGESDKEILISSYLCHPSMANNELSGPLALTFLYKLLSKIEKRYFTYRFFIGGETIGAIAYLSEKGEKIKQKNIGGFILTCCAGKNQEIVFKKAKRPDAYINNVTEYVLRNLNIQSKNIPFDPIGSDERQFSSPGYDMQMASIMSGKYSEYKEYHTSLDNKHFISFRRLKELINLHFKIIQTIEQDQKYVRTFPWGEPHLEKHKLYPNLAGKKEMDYEITKRMRILNYCDGHHTIIEICSIFGYFKDEVEQEVELLVNQGLLKNVPR